MFNTFHKKEKAMKVSQATNTVFLFEEKGKKITLAYF